MFSSLINMYQFVDLDPGDLYTIEMVVLSLGDDVTRVERRYTFYDSTHPLQPTIVTNVTVTEHAVHFGWTNPVYFQVCPDKPIGKQNGLRTFVI